jgi:hypothetical protein
METLSTPPVEELSQAMAPEPHRHDPWPFDGSFDDLWLYPPDVDPDDETRFGPLSGYP